MCLNKNSFDLLLISFVFYIHNSLEKQTKNSGVLLNCTYTRLHTLAPSSVPAGWYDGTLHLQGNQGKSGNIVYCLGHPPTIYCSFSVIFPCTPMLKWVFLITEDYRHYKWTFSGTKLEAANTVCLPWCAMYKNKNWKIKSNEVKEKRMKGLIWIILFWITTQFTVAIYLYFQ